jgi:hypothetical protein
MARSHSASILVVSLAVASSACTAIAKLEAPSLKSTPDAAGVVVVEADITVHAAIFGIKSSADPVGGILARVDGTQEAVRGGSSSGYVVFPDLPPGRWQLVMIEGKWQSGNYYTVEKYGVPLKNVEEYTLDVRAGEPVYIGTKIDDDRRSDTQGVRYSRRNDPDAERKAWKWMGDVYEKSAWAPVFRARLANPEAHPAAVTAPKNGG